MELGMFTSGYQRYPLERAFSARIPPEVYERLQSEMEGGR